jgi:hypothetical protein
MNTQETTKKKKLSLTHIMTIKQLQKEEKELSRLLSENRNQQRELNKNAFIQKYGIDIGDTVEWIDGNTPRKGIVSEIQFSGVKPNSYRALLFNADGKVGKRDMRIWSFSFKSLKLVSKAVS